MNTMEVTARKLNVRRQPELRPDNIIGTLPRQSTVKVLTKNAGWALVECAADWLEPGPTQQKGYVSLTYLKQTTDDQTSSSTKYVTAPILNVRTEPKVNDNTKVGSLRMLSAVEIVEELDGWYRIRFEPELLDSNSERDEGYVSAKYLRNTERPSVEALLQPAAGWWRLFKHGQGKEHTHPFSAYVGEMWNNLGMNYDGYDRDWPWSAAYISSVVRKAGPAYDGFKFSASHATYLNDAISDRLSAHDSPFLGYRITEQRPAIGDLIGMRRSGSNTTYDSALKQGSYKSHADIIVQVNDKVAYTLGGNVNHSVTLKTFPLNNAGKFDGSNREFVLLKNQTS